MNEMLDSQLSAMFDNELPAAECELLARRLSRDESLRVRWRHYAVIGAALRGERGLALHINLAQRVHGVLAAEPAMAGAQALATERESGLAKRIWQGAAGVAVAAGVAAVSVFWLRSQSPLVAETRLAQAPAAAAAPEVDVGGPESYVVPATGESRPMVPTAELANYVVAHSEYSAPLSRRNLLSSLVASDAGTASMPEESEDAAVMAETPGSSEPNEAVESPAAHVQDTP